MVSLAFRTGSSSQTTGTSLLPRLGRVAGLVSTPVGLRMKAEAEIKDESIVWEKLSDHVGEFWPRLFVEE